jgi:hypothetical protein
MKRIFNLVIVIGLLNACHPSQAKLMDFAKGASMSYPVDINEKTARETAEAEQQWISNHYKFYKVVYQRLVSASHARVMFDVITIEHVDGAKQDIYFRINRFFTDSRF